jgi:hypothetical protein
MRKGIFIVLMIIFCVNTFAQKNFEGEIIYKNVSKFDTSKNGIVKVFLKGKKMLTSNEFKENEEPIYTLYDFEKGKSFSPIPTDSIVIFSLLMQSPFNEIIDSSKSNELILGYHCLKMTYKISMPMNTYFSSIDALFSDKILFNVPLNMRSIYPFFILFHDSSTSLDVKIKVNKLPESNNKDVELEYKAISVNNSLLNDSIFEIPKYLKEISTLEYSKLLIEKVSKISKDLGISPKDLKDITDKAVEKFNKQQKEVVLSKKTKKAILKKKSS